MAIQNARSNTTGAAPASLLDGQIALGQADGILFTRTSAGAVRRFLLPKRAAVADAAYPCNAFDTYVGVASLTASRAITLPSAASYPPGHALVIVDESGACSSSLVLTLTAAGSDKINGAATLAMAAAYLGLILFSDGTSKWTAIAIPGAGGSTSGALLAANNLSDLNSVGLAWANLQSAPGAPSASASLLRAAAGQDQYATGAITLTMPNGGAGWRTGTIKNANTATGTVTLAVPSGATLDGVANGTTALWPFQRARIVQTGATAYVTDWVERTPVLGMVTISSAVASFDLIVPDGYPRLRLRGSNISLSAAANLGLRVGDAGGVKAGTNDYYSQRNQAFSSTGQGRAAIDSYGYLTVGQSDASSASRAMLDLLIHAGASGSNPKAIGQSFIYDGSDPYVLYQVGVDYPGTTTGAMGRATLLRLLASTGNINTGSFTLTGEP